MSEEAPGLVHPFWRFSLAVYGDKAVQAECLDVQERLGADVNLLLFCAYLGAVEGIRLEPGHLADAQERVGAWHAEIVRSLRAARRALKPWSVGEGAVARETSALRKQVQGAELRAEQIEQGLLWEWLQARRDELKTGDPAASLAANIATLLVGRGGLESAGSPESLLPNLLRAAQSAASDGTQRGATTGHGVDSRPR